MVPDFSGRIGFPFRRHIFLRCYTFLKLSQIDLQTLGMAHHVGGKFGGEAPAVGKSPEELRRFAAVCQPHKAEIHLRGDLHILMGSRRTVL